MDQNKQGSDEIGGDFLSSKLIYVDWVADPIKYNSHKAENKVYRFMINIFLLFISLLIIEYLSTYLLWINCS